MTVTVMQVVDGAFQGSQKILSPHSRLSFPTLIRPTGHRC